MQSILCTVPSATVHAHARACTRAHTHTHTHTHTLSLSLSLPPSLPKGMKLTISWKEKLLTASSQCHIWNCMSSCWCYRYILPSWMHLFRPASPPQPCKESCFMNFYHLLIHITYSTESNEFYVLANTSPPNTSTELISAILLVQTPLLEGVLTEDLMLGTNFSY